MDMSGPVAIFLFFLLLLVDMFFYGFDAAIDNLNEKEILHKAEEEKDRRSMRLSEMISRPGIYINTVQLVITLINILMGAFYLNIWLQTIDKGLHVINVGGMSLENVPTGVLSGIATVLSFIAMIYILLTFGVLIPRKMASRQPEKWAYACIDPIYIITRLLAPLTGLVNLTAKGILFFGCLSCFQNNLSHKLHGIHIDSSLCGTNIHRTAYPLCTGKCLRNRTDQKLLCRCHSLTYKSCISTDKVHSHLLGSFIQGSGYCYKIICSFACSTPNQTDWCNRNSFVYNRNSVLC